MEQWSFDTVTWPAIELETGRAERAVLTLPSVVYAGPAEDGRWPIAPPCPALGMPPPHSSCHVAFRVANLHVATASHTSDRSMLRRFIPRGSWRKRVKVPLSVRFSPEFAAVSRFTSLSRNSRNIACLTCLVAIANCFLFHKFIFCFIDLPNNTYKQSSIWFNRDLTLISNPGWSDESMMHATQRRTRHRTSDTVEAQRHRLSVTNHIHLK